MTNGQLSKSLEETLAIFERIGDPGEPLTTNEVTEHLTISRRSTYDRLERLVEHGLLETKKAGSRGRVWWRPVDSVGNEVADTVIGSNQEDAEQTLSLLVDTIPGVVYRCHDEPGWPMTYVSDDCGDLTGYAAAAVESGEVSWGDDVIHPEDREQVRDEIRDQLIEGDTFEIQYRILTDDDEQRWVWERGCAVPDEMNPADVLEGVVIDITGQKRTQRELVDREQQLREEKEFTESILNNQRDIIYAFSMDGEFRRWNQRFNEVTGYTDDEIAEMIALDFIADDAREETVAALDQVIEDGESLTIELPLETADGDVIPYEFTATPLTDQTGDSVGLAGIGRDITERKDRERQLQRQREELARELDDVFDRIDDAFYAVDESFRFTYVNERAEELLQRPAEELLGTSVWDQFPNATETDAWDAFHEALETQQATSYSVYFDPLDFWVEANIYPSESGLSVYFRDVTEQKKRERELEQYEVLTETASDVIITIDDESRIQNVNPAVAEVFGYEPDELVGESLTKLMPERFKEGHRAGLLNYLGSNERRIDWDYIELPGVTADGTEIPLAISFSEYEHDGEHYFTGILRDISERKERERELEESERRYRTLAENYPDGIVTLFDREYRYTLADGKGFDRIPFEPTDLEGRHYRDVWDAETGEQLEPLFEAALDGEEESTELSYQGRDWIVRAAPITDEEGEVFAGLTIAQDITERKEREKALARQRSELEERERAMHRAYEIIGDADQSFSEQIEALLEAVRETVGTDFATFSNVDEEYVFEAVDVPSDVNLPAGKTVPLPELPVCRHVTETEQTLAFRDIEAEAPELADPTWGINSYLGAPVFAGDGVYGTFCFYGMEPRAEEFSEWEVAFVELLSNWVGNEIERQQFTDQLTALNNLNAVIREITDAVIDQSTREEIEVTVCEHLASRESYVFAWIGDVDAATQTLNPRTEAGADGYLGDVTITIDPDDEHGEGPTGRAIRTGEIQTTQDIHTDPRYEPWRDVAEEYGFRSSAAIPIVHGDTTYGVLNVYSDRPRAFEGQERTVISQLGEIVGHAIAAVERKQALMSDEVVEFEFHIPNVFEALDIPVGSDGRITLEEVVPVSEGEYLVYGHATAEAVETLHAIVREVPHWQDVTVYDDDGETRFALRLSEPPVLSTLASLGGSVEEAVIENGDYRMRLHLSPAVESRTLIDAVQDAYPTVEMVARRQVTRNTDPTARLKGVFDDALTERQRAVLQAAFHAGFFEWPRETSGEEVAESLDVAPPTFHQHLRKAEQKIFDSLLTEAV